MVRTIFEQDFNNAEIAVGAVENFVPSSADRNKYASFNHLEVANKSAVNIEVRLNGSLTRDRILGAGDIMVLEKDDDVRYDWVVIANLDGAAVVAASTVKIIMKKVI